jgi:DNA primase
MFPITDRTGKHCAFGARLLAGDGPKYINSGETFFYKKRETLFALSASLPEIRRTKTIYICEGYMDTIALHQAGVTNAAAPLGTAFTAEQAALLRRYAEKIIFFFDSDSAGCAAAAKSILIAKKAGFSCYVVDYEAAPDNGSEKSALPKDPADILKDFGAGGLTKIAKCVIIDIEFLSIYGRRLHKDSGSDSESKAVASLFHFIECAASEVERAGYFKYIAEEFNLDERVVINDYNRRVAADAPMRAAAEKREAASGVAAVPVTMNDELRLLIAAALSGDGGPALFLRVREQFPVSVFKDANARELYLALEEWRRNGIYTVDELLLNIKNDALKACITEKAAGGEFSGGTDNVCERIVADGVKKLKIRVLKSKNAKLLSEINLAENASVASSGLVDTRTLKSDLNGNYEEIQRLQNESNEIDIVG